MFNPKGNSMTPLISSGDAVTIEPFSERETISVGMIVLAKVHSRLYLHKITAINGKRIQIGNNKGHINGWTNESKLYGKVTKVEKPNESKVQTNSSKSK